MGAPIKYLDSNLSMYIFRIGDKMWLLNDEQSVMTVEELIVEFVADRMMYGSDT